MKQLIYKSNLKPAGMPIWLACILNITLNSLNRSNTLCGSPEEFRDIRRIITDDLRQLQVKSEVTAELVTDEGQSVIFIKRSGRILVSIYYQEQ